MIEILIPTIPRYHCIDLFLENLRLADKPKDTQILVCISGNDEKYTHYVQREIIKIFGKNRSRFIKYEEGGIEHDQVRGKESGEKNQKKILNIYNVYNLLHLSADKRADYYWIMEYDTLFPLDTYQRYFDILTGLNGDIVTGCSYYWHIYKKRNFWNLNKTRVFPEGDNCDDCSWSVSDMEPKEQGVVKLGATGLGNILVKSNCFKTWYPLAKIREGADISFFIHAAEQGYTAYGIWGLYLPHITKYENGDIEILGRINKSLINIIGGQNEN